MQPKDNVDFVLYCVVMACFCVVRNMHSNNKMVYVQRDLDDPSCEILPIPTSVSIVMGADRGRCFQAPHNVCFSYPISVFFGSLEKTCS